MAMASPCARATFAAFLAAFLLSFSARHVAGDALPESMSAGLAARPSSARVTPRYVAPKGISYKGGSVMVSKINLYLIWYGDWSAYASSQDIIRQFLLSLGNTNTLQGGKTVRNLFNINLHYSDISNDYIKGDITIKQEVNDSYSLGTEDEFTEDRAGEILLAAFSTADTPLPQDGSGIYLILTSPDVYVTGFCDTCGWRGYVASGLIKYALLPNSLTQCPQDCGALAPSINGDEGADGLVGMISTVISSIATDPNFSGWSDANGLANGEKCAFTLGQTFTVPSGALYNMVGRNSMKFLAYQSWDLRKGYCVTSAKANVNRTNVGTYLKMYAKRYFQKPKTVKEAPLPDIGCYTVPIYYVGSFIIRWNVDDRRKNHVGCGTVVMWTDEGCSGSKLEFALPGGVWDPLNYNYTDTRLQTMPFVPGSFSCKAL